MTAFSFECEGCIYLLAGSAEHPEVHRLTDVSRDCHWELVPDPPAAVLARVAELGGGR